jgi:Protein of unknown function (DUF732)
MKKMIAASASALVMAGVGGAAVLAPSASAYTTNSGGDTDVFVNAVIGAGQTNTYGRSGILAAGLQVCREMDTGMTPRQAMNYLYDVSPLTWAQAETFVNLAAVDLCPYHASQGYDTVRLYA